MTASSRITISQHNMCTFSPIFAVFVDAHLSVTNWQPSFLDLLPTTSKLHVNVCWGSLFLFTDLRDVECLSHKTMKTTQSDDNRRSDVIYDVKQTQSKDKDLIIMTWHVDLFAFLPQKITVLNLIHVNNCSINIHFEMTPAIVLLWLILIACLIIYLQFLILFIFAIHSFVHFFGNVFLKLL